MRSVDASAAEIKRSADALVGADVADTDVDYYQTEDEDLASPSLPPLLIPATDIRIKSGRSSNGSGAGRECEITLRDFAGSAAHRRTAVFDADWNLTSLIVAGVVESGESYHVGADLSQVERTLALDAMAERLHATDYHS